jgi:hypothetical protein
MLILQLIVLYFGLLFIDIFFDLEWKVFSFCLMLISAVISISLFIHYLPIPAVIWMVVSLLEFKSYISTEE